MSTEELIKKQTVKVNNGSGVIVQPASELFSYIFTVKHNIQKNVDDPKAGLLDNKEISIYKIDNSETDGAVKVDILDIYCSESFDIAIIKIPFQLGTEICPCYRTPILDEKLRLWGYPSYAVDRTTKLSEQLNVLELKVHRNDGDDLELRNTSSASYEYIQGYSGGGLFCVDQKDNKSYLIAIENRMSHADAEHEHIKAIPIFYFKELIYQNDLVQVYPHYLNDFSLIHRNIFDFENCFNPQNLCRAKAKLQSIASKYAEIGISSPLEIIQKLNDSLVVHGRDPIELENEKLWISFLEIVVIKNLVDGRSSEERIEITDIKNLFDTIRFVFIDSNKTWKRYIKEILCTKLESVKDGGIVLLILIGEQDMPDEPIIDSEYFIHAEPNISLGLQSDQNLIDLAEASPILTGSIKVVHLAKLHSKCFVNKEFELNNIRTAHERISFLKKNYSQFIPKEEAEK